MERERDQQLMLLPLSDASDEDKLAMVATTPLSGSSGTGPRPRGRPPGSKNRPKPPVIITRESESAMHPAILEIAAGCDILDAVSAFSRRKRLGVSILSGSGAVANLSLRHHPASASHVATTITFAGRFDILSIGGTYLPPAEGEAASVKVAVPVTVSVAGGQGQVIGGQVAGGLTAAGAVVVVAATFGNADMYQLPYREEDKEVKVEDIGVHNVGPTDMTLWGSRSPRAPPPHFRHPPPPPPPQY